MKKSQLGSLNDAIIGCTKCPRLLPVSSALLKIKRFVHEKYWRKPFPSFDDPNTQIILVGLRLQRMVGIEPVECLLVMATVLGD